MRWIHVAYPCQSRKGGDELEALLEYLYERRNFDFRGYKRASLTRRIFKCMQMINIEDYQRYMEILEANPGEFAELFNTILINVTSLMRDKDAWDALATQVIPAIIDSKASEEPIRIWSAGCASGEEAYWLAVLFADAMGEDRFRRLVKIYATDADIDALATARQGRYRGADLAAAFGEELSARFFESDGDFGVFRGDLRRALIFGRHDLVQDPPISRIDLVTCRNTLMYFTSDVQSKILANFHFALNSGGYLFLGKSEALVTRSKLFLVADQRQHIMRKDGSVTAVRRVAPGSQRKSRTGHGAETHGGRVRKTAWSVRWCSTPTAWSCLRTGRQGAPSRLALPNSGATCAKPSSPGGARQARPGSPRRVVR